MCGRHVVHMARYRVLHRAWHLELQYSMPFACVHHISGRHWAAYLEDGCPSPEGLSHTLSLMASVTG
jgi:hypothetical protein